MRLLTERDVEFLIASVDPIDAAAEAFRLHASQGSSPPVRGDLRRNMPKSGCLMLAGAAGPDLTVKSNVHAWPADPQAPRYWGSLLTLWDALRAEPRALVASRGFNDHRTAAGFAAAARALAPKHERTLAVYGAGKTAPMTIRYLRTVCPGIERILITGRNLRRAEDLATREASRPGMEGIEVRTADAAEAAGAADVIVTVTTSDTPVFPGARVRSGALVILGGANRPTAREADDALMRRARVFVDARDGALEKAGDLALAAESGAFDPADIVGEIGAFLDGAVPEAVGRDVTVFKSMGLAVQDVVLARRLVAAAEAQGIGTILDLEGAAP